MNFGAHKGEPAWQEVPGEHRAVLRRLLVVQGDTEPASVEQQRMLGSSCPSMYDLRNIFQVNVEEGRHLWAMVYLLHAYFGREGREEAEELLHRNSGSEESPRILGAFAADPGFDLVITNGHIVDGTGSPWYSGDIGIRDGRIAAIGEELADKRVQPRPQMQGLARGGGLPAAGRGHLPGGLASGNFLWN